MAGEGSRFKSAGYQDPKPFIDVNGRAMIDRVIENVSIPTDWYNLYTITLKDHWEKYGKIISNSLSFYYYIKNFANISIDKITEGAVCSALTAKELINNDNELVVTDCDHLVGDYAHIRAGVDFFRKHNADGGFWNFLSDDPKYSYVRIGSDGLVKEVMEKVVISNLANTGSYYFKTGKIFVKYAEELVSKNLRTRGEYYLSKVYDLMLLDKLKIKPFMVNEFIGLGVPSDLENYLKQK